MFVFLLVQKVIEVNFSPIHTPKIGFLSMQHLRLLSAVIRATVWDRRLLLCPDRILKSNDTYRRFNQSYICLTSKPLLILFDPSDRKTNV